MKKFTMTLITTLSLMLAFIISGYAQVTKNVTVGPAGTADYENIIGALNGAGLDLSSGDSLIIHVPAGPKAELTGNLFANWGKALHILIIGAGADVSVLVQAADTLGNPLTAMPPATAPTFGGRMWQIGSADINGSTLTIKNLTFRYMGNTLAQSVGSIMNFVNELDLTVTYENVIFDQCIGRSLINHNKDKINFVFDNCLFIGCVVAPRATNQDLVHQGLIHRGFGGNLTVRNTTFMSNSVINASSAEHRTGGLLRLSSLTNWITNASFENVVMVNNTYSNESATAIMQPMVSFRPQADNPEVSVYVSMKDVVMAGNFRADNESDIDLLYDQGDKIIFNEESTGNFFNKALFFDGTSNVPAVLPGASVSTAFTYASLNMVVADGLPTLTPDAFGIGKVTFTSEPVNVNNLKGNEAHFSVYSSPYYVRVGGLKEGQKLEIFNMMGSKVATAVADNTEMRFELPSGIYIIRSGSVAQKVLAY